MPALEETFYGIARGLARGTIDGLDANKAAIPAIMEGVATGLVRGWQALTTKTYTEAGTDAAGQTVVQEVAQIADKPLVNQ